MLLFNFVKTFAKVGYQKGFGKKQFIKKIFITKPKINSQNTN
jgi:hypothetical protein